MDNKRNIPIFLMCGLYCLVLQIHSFQGQEIKIVTENSIPVVYNPKNLVTPSGKPLSLDLKEELVIGDPSWEKEPILSEVATIRADDNGNIYVLDRKDCMVKVFNREGRFLRNIGNKGQGPGEMTAPMGLEVLPNKELMAVDIGNRRIVIFTHEGELVREVPLKIFINRIVPDEAGNFIGLFLDRSGLVRTCLAWFDRDLNKLFPIGEIAFDMKNPSPLMNSIQFAVLKDNRVIWGETDTYKLKIIDKDGKIVRIIKKEYEPIKITEESKKRYFEEIGQLPAKMKLEFPKFFPPIRYISSDEEGRIFVRTYDWDEEGRHYYDVFDSEGKCIAKIALLNHPTCWKNGKLYSASETSEGLHIVKRFAVTWE